MTNCKRSVPLRQIAGSLLLFCCFPGCNLSGGETDRSVKEFANQVEELSKTVQHYVGTVEAPEELKKLQQYEYQVLSFADFTEAKEFSEKLNELGKERWDCFNVVRQPGDQTGEKKPQILAFCKRRPDTPLKYIPKTILSPQ